MAGYLVAERVIELTPEEEEGAGGFARYALYAAAAAAALAGAWLIAGPSSGSAPAPAAMTARTAELPVATDVPASNIRQIDMSKSAAQDGSAAAGTSAPAGPAAYSAPAASASATAATAEAPIPPKPIPRPAYTTVRAAPVIAAEPAARIAAPAAPAAEPEVAMVQTGAPPRDLGVLRDTAAAPAYATPVYVPTQPPAVAYEPSGPVPPMPVDDAANTAPPAGAPVHHQGLLGASERAVGTAWNWTTGAVDGVVRGVQQGF